MYTNIIIDRRNVYILNMNEILLSIVCAFYLIRIHYAYTIFEFEKIRGQVICFCIISRYIREGGLGSILSAKALENYQEMS